MANEAAALQIVIEAEDRASAVIERISEGLGLLSQKSAGLGKISGNPLSELDSVKEKFDSLDGRKGKVTLEADGSQVKSAVSAAQSYVDSFHGKSVSLNVATVYTTSYDSNYNKIHAGAHWAKGTSDAPEGIAMVNDEKGINDPRELIEHNGRLIMFEGRDVLVPLAKHDKVYTADQTKEIMKNLGIPNYAKGRNNSDSFTLAKEGLNHYTKTNSLSLTEELEKWQDLLKSAALTEKDIWDCTEEIYSLQKKINNELNTASESWIQTRTALNDWDEFGDSAINAFERVKERNKSELDAGRMTWSEYVKICSDTGSQMYDDRVKQSLTWLEHEKKYNGLSADDYIAGLLRMADYTKECYEQGLIDKEKYTEAATAIDEKYLDAYAKKLADEYSQWQKDASAWLSDRTMRGDWGDYNDSETDFYARAAERVRQFYSDGKIDWQTMSDDVKMYSDALYKLQQDGDSVYSEWLSNAQNWKTIRDTYDDWEEYGDSTVAYYGRCIDRISEMYAQGHIGWQKYMDESMNYQLDFYKAVSDEYDAVLSSQAQYISELKTEFSNNENALKSLWQHEDREADLGKINYLLSVYKNSVTERGKNKYEDLLNEKKKIEREEELYRLQTNNNAVLSAMQDDYKRFEAEKKNFLRSIRDTDISVDNVMHTFSAQFSSFGTETNRLLSNLISAVQNIKLPAANTNSTSYSDNRVITVNKNTGGFQGYGIFSSKLMASLR